MARLARVVGKHDTKRRWIVPVAGAAIVILVVGLLVWLFKPAEPQFNWERQLRTDANYSIEVPGPVQTTVEQETTAYGPTTVQRLQCQLSKPAATFFVQYSPFPANSPFLKMSAAQADASLDQFVNGVTERLDGKLIEQKPYTHAAGRGRSFRIQLAGRQQYHGRMLYLGPAQYQLSVIAPEEAEVPQYVTKFLNSFEYRGNVP